MSKIFILGDIHLGKGLGIGKSSIGEEPNSRIVDQLDLLNWVIEQISIHSVTDLFITGDIYEEAKPHPALIAYFMRWLAKIPHTTNVHIVVGNHDIMRTGSYVLSALDIIQEEIYENASDLPNISIYKEFDTISLDDVFVTIAPFRDRKMLGHDSMTDAIADIHNSVVKELKKIPKSANKMLIGHIALEGSMYIGDEVDDILNEIMCPLNIFKGYDAVWMGHVHRPQILSKKPVIAHTGSMDTSDFGETDHKKNVVLYDENFNYSLIELPNRNLKRLIIEVPKGANTTEYVSNYIENEDVKSFSEAIVKLQIKLQDKETPNVDRKEIEELIYKLGAFHICNFAEHRSITVVNTNKAVVTESMDELTVLKVYAQSKDWANKDMSEFIAQGSKIIRDNL